MAKIVDPDQLNQNTEITYTPGTKLIDLAVAGNLDDNSPGKSSGVTHQAVYSFTKEEWLTDSNLRKVRFPFKAIFEAKFEWINSWQPSDAQTRDLLRDGGFRVVLLDDEYACVISLGDMDNPAVDQPYYQNVIGFDQAAILFDKTGELNENILIFDGTNDYRDFLKTYVREEFKIFGEGNLLVDQDLSALTYQAYRLPLANTADPNWTVPSATIDGNTPYTNFVVTYLQGSGFTTYATATVYPAGAVVYDTASARWWFTPLGGTSNGANVGADAGVTDWEAYAGERQIGANWYAFNRIIYASSGTGTKEQYYNWAQRQLLKTSDINFDSLGSPNQDGYGTVNGYIAQRLLDFVGVDLITRPGVYVGNLDSNDANNIKFNDITVDGGGLDAEDVPVTSTTRTNPFVSAFNIVFNDVIVGESDADTYYTAYFQYTRRSTATDFATTTPSGSAYTLTSGTLDLTTRFANGEYIRITGFANGGNNGIFVLSSVAAGSMVCTRIDGQAVGTAEAIGPTVNLDENPYDSPDAIIVNDAGASPIAGQVSSGSIAHTFDYDFNTQGNRTAGTDAPIAIEVSGKVSTWVDGLFTITRATGLSFPLNPAEDQVYLNPV